MSKYLIQEKSLSDIADAIREKAGSAVAMNPAEMVEAILGIQAGGGNNTQLAAIIDKTITGYNDSNSANTLVGNYAFYNCQSLATVNFPVCKSIESYAFAYCSSLKTINFPVCKSIGSYAFAYCSSLSAVDFPVCTSVNPQIFNNCTGLTSASFQVLSSIGANMFSGCRNLTDINFPACTFIGSYAFTSTALSIAFFQKCTAISSAAFSNCTNLAIASFPMCSKINAGVFTKCSILSALILARSSICQLEHSNALKSTPIELGTGYVYVPASLVAGYQTASIWSYFSANIRAIEDSEFA